MSGNFVKLYGSILDSSVWSESLATRIVWITLLAMADFEGKVMASVGGLARRAQVPREACEEALGVLLAPDLDDRSGVEEGRRLRVIQRGWQIINHSYYRDQRTPTQVATAERVRRHREKQSVTCNKVTDGNPPSRSVLTDPDPDSDQDSDQREERARAPEALAAADAAPTHVEQGSPMPRPSRRKGWKRIPADWQPNDGHRELARAQQKDFEAELAKIRDHEFRTPRADADAAFRNWLRNDFATGRGRPAKDLRVQHDVGFDATANVTGGLRTNFGD